MGRVARPPRAPVPADGHRPMTTRGYDHDSPPHPAPHNTTHGTGPMHWDVVGQDHLQARTPARVAQFQTPMPPPSGTTATTAGPAPAPRSPQNARGRPPQSGRSGGWRRPRFRSGRQLVSPKRPRATPNRQAPNLCRPVRPPQPPRRLPLPPDRPHGAANACSSQPHCSLRYATGARDRPCADPGRSAGPAARGRRGRN